MTDVQGAVETPEEEEWDADPFAKLGITEEEARAALAERNLRSRRDRDSRICSCGHSMMAHKYDEGLGREICRAGKVICNCVQKEPVLKAQDARVFIRATEGAGTDHALLIGIMSARNKGHTLKWLKDPICRVCSVDGAMPVPMDESGRVVSGRSGTRNPFLCDEHFEIAKREGIQAAFQQHAMNSNPRGF